MELCTGGSLYDNYKRPEFRSERMLATVMKQMLSAVAHIHTKKIVHRDIKLENVLLANNSLQNPVIKLIDFGLAKVKKNQSDCLRGRAGTLFYMAPEVFSEQYTEKVDLWSVGVIMYILITKCIPFKGNTYDEIKAKILTKKFSFTGPQWDNINPLAIDLLKGLLNRNSQVRLSAREALDHEWIQKYSHKQVIDATLLPELEKINKSKRLKTFFMSLALYHLKSEKEIEPYRKLFCSLDAKSKGYIDASDLLQAYQVKYKDLKLAQEGVERFFAGSDFDQNGKIFFTEFLVACFANSLLEETMLKKLFNLLTKMEITSLRQKISTVCLKALKE